MTEPLTMFFSCPCLHSSAEQAIPCLDRVTAGENTELSPDPYLDDLLLQLKDFSLEDETLGILRKKWGRSLANKQEIVDMVILLKQFDTDKKLVLMSTTLALQGYPAEIYDSEHIFPTFEFVALLRSFSSKKSKILDALSLQYLIQFPTLIPEAAKAFCMIFGARHDLRMTTDLVLHFLKTLRSHPHILQAIHDVYQKYPICLNSKLLLKILRQPDHAREIACSHVKKHFPEELLREAHRQCREDRHVLQYFEWHRYQAILEINGAILPRMSHVDLLLQDLEKEQSWHIADMLAQRQPQIPYSRDLLDLFDFLHKEHRKFFILSPAVIEHMPPVGLMYQPLYQDYFVKIVLQSGSDSYHQHLVTEYFELLQVASAHYLTELLIWLFVAQQPSLYKKFQMASALYAYHQISKFARSEQSASESNNIGAQDHSALEQEIINQSDHHQASQAAELNQQYIQAIKRTDLQGYQTILWFVLYQMSEKQDIFAALTEIFSPYAQPELQQPYQGIAIDVSKKIQSLTTEKLIDFLCDDQHFEIWQRVVFSPEDYEAIQRSHQHLLSFKEQIVQLPKNVPLQEDDIHAIPSEILQLLACDSWQDLIRLTAADVLLLIEEAEHDFSRDSGRELAKKQMSQWQKEAVIALNAREALLFTEDVNDSAAEHPRIRP